MIKNREEWLCAKLNDEKLKPELRAKYEAELDQIAEDLRVNETKRKTALAEEAAKRAAKRAEIQARLEANDLDFIEHYGQEEFGDDYELVQEGDARVVYSKVAKDDQEHRRVHLTEEAAKADLRYLFYNRLYSKYVRNGDVDYLAELIA